jgi:nucleoside-diphosphate-sugar epimerase
MVHRALTADRQPPSAVVHLAAIVGFPACQQAGRKVTWRYNVEATRAAFGLAEELGARRFIFASTYSVYGLAQDGTPVDETSPLHPQSLYAETKIAAENYLLEQASKSLCAPIIYRFATLFGISPRTRFDLIINQFVLEAFVHRKLVIYQRGYARSFVHVRDVVRALVLALEADLDSVRGEIFNVGSDQLNYTKDEIVAIVQREIPGTTIEYKDLSFGGDMRDIRVSFRKIRNVLGFVPEVEVMAGIREVRDALETELIRDPMGPRYRNAPFILQ